ncbi:hypothetical protein SUGI_1226860 [Cryptomeria japonica]|uniref:Uncharacterized protein n=1 Tax=Cryptomeria japonica TaxID=3369 RepID=A0AAD3RPG1_CRYJA|nr:hypothetical protein SUGI_1226860 [Cryptomeria japonica]
MGLDHGIRSDHQADRPREIGGRRVGEGRKGGGIGQRDWKKGWNARPMKEVTAANHGIDISGAHIGIAYEIRMEDARLIQLS